MKIIHIISSINRGGAENHLFNLASMQSSMGNDVKIIYFRGDDYWSSFYNKKKIKTYKFRLRNNFNLFKIIKVLLGLKKFLDKEKPDIVHAHLAWPEVLVSIIKILSKNNFKFIITKHLDSFILEGSYGQNKLLNGLFIEKIIFNLADQIIFISKNVQRYFFTKIKGYKYKTRVIYYGINDKYFKSNIRTHKNYKYLRSNKSEFIILNIARHIPQKKIDKLIDGFHQYLKINYNSKLVLVGNGPDNKKLKQKAKNLNINHKINWIDYAENIENIFKISDVFCLTSDYEGLGLVLLESLLLKKPIITINKSAMKEIVVNNYNGISLNKNFSSKDLSKAFKEINFNSKLRSKFQKNGIKQIKKKFNLKKMYLLTHKIYNKSL